MNNRYNIALIPTTQQETIIGYAHKLADIADRYLLGRESLPHITLYQFQAKESELDETWSQVCQSIENKSMALVFESFSCIILENNIFWASLLPNEQDQLKALHNVIAGIIHRPIKSSYDPHMTLISSKNPDYKTHVNELSRSYIPIQDTFVLSLGRSDEIGQYTEVIFTILNTQECKF
jgi:2'-5' RNA ligase